MPYATPIHLEPVSWPRARIVGGCVARVLADSNRTDDIMVAEEITAQAQLRYLLSQGVFDSEEGRALLLDRPSFVDVDLNALMSLPAESLGGALARFHREHGLSPTVYQKAIEYTDDPDAAYLMTRIRHSHDLWHVLTGLGVQGHEEILLHAFSLAQTGLPSSVALMALGSLKHMVLEARLRTFVFGLLGAYRAGAAAQNLIPVYWERYFETPVELLRRKLGVRPLTKYA